jgi:sulfatase maturation enzyme AslB (radical SAM superfamily)
MGTSNYCVLPFNSVSISASGEIRQCCNAGYDGSNTYVSELDINGIINNNFIQDIRQSFIENTQHSKCSRCWKQEAMGSMSFREVANRNKYYGIGQSITNRKKVIEFEDIEYIDITLGNKCNLACRMCNWSSSSLLAQQLKELGKHTGPIDLELDDESKNKVIELFRRSVNLKSIYMLGGEPLINPLNDEILDLLIETGQSKNIFIHYNTNLQVNKIEDYLEKWSHFKGVELQASIDGCEEVYNYIRWPGNWKKVLRNLTTAVQKGNDDTLKVSISTTIQNINALNIPKLINMCQTLEEQAVPFFFIPVVGTMTLDVTPKRVLKEAIDLLEAMPKRMQIPIDDLLANYRDAYNLKIDKKKVQAFFDEQKMFDLKRNQNLFETIPYFIELADEFNIERW